MTEYKFTDKAAIGSVKKTVDGYIVAQSRALRSGIQEYHASEFGILGNHTVKVYRPPESVFSKDSLKSLAQAPITIEHPAELVSPENWKDLAVGELGADIMRDGEWIVVSPMIKDAGAIAAIEGGKVELSAGYVADMMPSDNPEYDFVMGPPRYNHLAIVDKARAGSKARIGDAAKPWGAAPLTKTEEKEVNMTDLKTVVVGDKAVQVAAADADVITKMIADHKTAMDELKAELATVKIEAADAAKLVKTDEDIAKIIADGVKELVAVADKARAMVKDYDAGDKDAMTIRREVIAKVYGDEAVADLSSDAEIKAAFTVAQSQAKADPVRDTLKDAKPKKQGSAWDGIIKTKGEK
jgi:uncharacterized protein